MFSYIDDFLGRPVLWWAKIAAVLAQHDIEDADQLAYKLRARGSRPPIPFGETFAPPPEEDVKSD